jgi:hypothetical protein
VKDGKMILTFVGCSFLFMCLLGLAALGMALCVALKLLEWALRLGLCLLEPQPGDIVISIDIEDDDEDQRPMRDVTPKAKRIR